MNVLQLISSGAGFYGAERVSVTLSAELQKLGAKTVVAAFRNRAKAVHLEVLDRAKDAGLPTETIDCSGRLDRSAMAAIANLITHYKIDIVHSHGIKSDLYALLSTGRGKARLVGTCHSWTMDSAKHRAISLLDRFLLRQFDAVAVVSELLTDRLRRAGINPLKITTVENGIDCVPFVRASWAIDRPRQYGSGLVVGTVGRLVPVKGLYYLLNAARLLLPAFPSATFVIVGDGPELEPLKSYAAGLGISDSVRFVGTSNDMPDVYASFDVFSLPSLSEGMPMALMEAMASGLPVVASSVGSVPKMIIHKENGMLTEPANTNSLVRCLQELLSNPQARIALGQSAQTTATARFSGAAMARRYLSVYESVVAQHDGSSIVRSAR